MAKKNRIPVELSDKDLHNKMKAAAALLGKNVPEVIEIAEKEFLKNNFTNLLT
jgi:hypothetical protein